jgi:adenylate cyclase
MGVEIERRFLVRGDDWPRANAVYMRQGYLNSARERVVRIRVAGEGAQITIKGGANRGLRLEFEYEIPLADANQMLDEIAERYVVEKTRYRVTLGGLTWEIDEFTGLNEGLVVAEATLESDDQRLEKPEWVGSDISGDYRYATSNLAREPYSTWNQA